MENKLKQNNHKVQFLCVSGGSGFHAVFIETLIGTGHGVHVGLTCVCQTSDLSQGRRTRVCHELHGGVHMGGGFTSVCLRAQRRVLHVWRVCETHVLHLFTCVW